MFKRLFYCKHRWTIWQKPYQNETIQFRQCLKCDCVEEKEE